MKRVLPTILVSLSIGVMSSSQAAAGILVSNWDITGDTLSFDLSGTIDAGASVGTNNSFVLYIGVPNDTDWVTSVGAIQTIINHGGGARDLRTDFGGYFEIAGGDYARVETSDGLAWAIGDSVNASVQFSGGSLIAANVNSADLIVTAGFNSLTTFPDPTAQVGSAATTVPEPGSLMLFGLGTLGLGVLARRKKQTV